MPGIVESYLDGSEPIVFASTALSNPSSISGTAGRLFIVNHSIQNSSAQAGAVVYELRNGTLQKVLLPEVNVRFISYDYLI